MTRSLSQDVRLLGGLLGETLRAHGGEELFATVERMRRAARASRSSEDEARRVAARRALDETAASLDADTAAEVVRAFASYFQLVNLAEDVERTRVLRRRARRDEADDRDSLPGMVRRLRREGAGRDEVLAALDEISIRFVFTSHPTEARRRTTERILATVRRGLTGLDRSRLTPGERSDVHREIRAAVEALWHHEDHRPDRPEVLDEVKEGLWYLRHVVLGGMPRVQRRLADALADEFGDIDPAALPVPFSFGSWMGADRDGNPFVTDEVMEKTLGFHRHIVLTRYLDDLAGLVDPVAITSDRMAPTEALSAALERAGRAVPDRVEEFRRRNPEEPCRRLLSFVRERIERTRDAADGAYARPDELVRDLLALRGALVASNARALPDDRLLDLIVRARCFGFVLAPLDVREDSRVHRRVVGELLGDPDYPGRPDDERRAALARLSLPEDRQSLSDEARRLLGLFATIARLTSRYGEEAISAYCISMTESAADVLEIHRLAELHGVASGLDFVPLVETRAGLTATGDLLRSLFSEPGYRAHLAARGDRQELLVGYSDSMKEAGILASRVGVLDAQLAAAEACREAGVALRVFHGRGGSLSRGGGPTHRAILALPRAAFSGDMKITEQGETRAHHFGDPDLSARYVERSVGAALAVRLQARADPAAGAGVADELARLADDSRRAYEALVGAEGFLDYFRTATPFDVVANLNIGSRPSRRGDVDSLDALRAIPWVFSWSQSRHLVTGWYGVGTALAKSMEEDAGALAALYAGSPFLADVLDNVQMTLAKADLPIASRYAELAPEAARGIFERIRAEYDETLARVLALRDRWELLEDDPVLKWSIRLRNPYVDPLSWLQVEALRRMRAGETAWEKVAIATVHGIAAGLRNTG